MQAANDNQAITDVLLGLLTGNEQVLPEIVNQFLNFKQEAPKAIVSKALSTRVIQKAYTYFNEKLFH